MEATSKRKMNEAGQKVATRLLYVLKNKFVGKNHFFYYIHIFILYIYVLRISCFSRSSFRRYCNAFAKISRQSQDVRSWLRSNWICQKSKGEKDDMKRICLLNLTVEKLKTRSLADRVFVSPNSSASDPFNKREEKKRVDVSHNCKQRHSR